MDFKPCPFCGNKDIAIEKLSFFEDIFLKAYHYKADIVCKNCNTLKAVKVVGNDLEDCIKTAKEEWNKREV